MLKTVRGTMKKLAILAVGALLALFAVGCSNGGDSADSSSASAALVSSQNQGLSTEEVDLNPKVAEFEHAAQDIDPLTLVDCTNPAAKVSCDTRLDLRTTGVQHIVYTVELDGVKDQRTVDFTVKDTKAPEIMLASNAVEVQRGTEYHPETNIAKVEDPAEGELSWVLEVPGASDGFVAQPDQVTALYTSGWYYLDGQVDTNNPGNYDITVRASDAYGNESTKAFTVVVKDNAAANAPAGQVVQKHTYILNITTGQFHYDTCEYAAGSEGDQRESYTGYRSEVVNAGYAPCPSCNP